MVLVLLPRPESTLEIFRLTDVKSSGRAARTCALVMVAAIPARYPAAKHADAIRYDMYQSLISRHQRTLVRSLVSVLRISYAEARRKESTS